MIIARMFRISESVPARETALVVPERIAPRTGARSVVPQVGQPEPRTASPATSADDSRPEEPSDLIEDSLVVFLADSSSDFLARFSARLCLATKITNAIKTDWSKMSIINIDFAEFDAVAITVGVASLLICFFVYIGGVEIHDLLKKRKAELKDVEDK